MILQKVFCTVSVTFIDYNNANVDKTNQSKHLQTLNDVFGERNKYKVSVTYS